MRPRNQQGLRRRQFESLEPRQMLAYTIITPGEGGSFPRWAYDMATAIVAKDGAFDKTDANGDGIVDIIQNARVDLNGQRQFVGSMQIAPNILLYDWTSVSNQDGIAGSSLVTQTLSNWLQQNIPTTDVHLIGHGRGAMVNMAALRGVTDPSRLLHLQMTTLDPYSRGNDGAFEANPGGQVDFADNYFQDINLQELSGKSLPGALNFRLNDQLNAWNGRAGIAGNHHEVHDWYHWTIAPEFDASVVPRSDAGLVVPNSTVRTALYNSYTADLNKDGAQDNFGSGAKIGYYFTLAGGGIGKAILVANVDSPLSLFSLDVQTGELPLYLGHPKADDPDQIAYHPRGELYHTDSRSQLARGQMQFDANNNPVWTRTPIGSPQGPSFPYSMEFSRDGRLARGEANLMMELSPATGEILRGHQFNWSVDWIDAIAFDPNLNLLFVRNPTSQSRLPSLNYFDTVGLAVVESFDIDYRDITELAMIDGLLYAFRENGEYATINVMTRKIIERGTIALPAGATLHSMTSATNLVKNRWHNPVSPHDVNEDGRVNSSDVLALINTLLIDGTRSLSAAGELRSYQYDVTNDSRVNSSDILAVINHILQPATPLAAEPFTVESLITEPLTAEPLAAEAPASTPSKSTPLGWLAFAMALDLDTDEEFEFQW